MFSKVFNNIFWKRFDRKKPKESGWYLCTLAFPFSSDIDGELYQTYVIDLYWYSSTQRFIDNRVRQVFDTYEVYGYEECNKKVLLQDGMKRCDRTDSVVAWKEMPKAFIDKERRYYK